MTPQADIAGGMARLEAVCVCVCVCVCQDSTGQNCRDLEQVHGNKASTGGPWRQAWDGSFPGRPMYICVYVICSTCSSNRAGSSPKPQSPSSGVTSRYFSNYTASCSAAVADHRRRLQRAIHGSLSRALAIVGS